MMKKRIIAMLVGVSMVISMLVGCGSSTDSGTNSEEKESATAETEEGESKGTIGWIMINLTNPF